VPTLPQGRAVIDWTIGGAKDPNSCAQSSVAAIQIAVSDASGAPAGTFQQSCNAFSTSITLSRGSYTAVATLIDPRGQARTTSVSINPFVIRGNDSLNIPIDFPPASFREPT
jgi:hypothetical protein